MRKCADCSNPAYRKSRYCNHHRHKRDREKNPHRYFYERLKSNAKRRGKVFTITLEDFIEFCNEYKYLDDKGREKNAYHVDRHIEELGYVKGNLRKLKNIDNVRKYVEWKDRDENGNSIFKTVTRGIDDSVEGDCPF